MSGHRAHITHDRRPDLMGTKFYFRCLCGKWRREVFIPDVVQRIAGHAVQPAAFEVFEAGMAFERHARGIEDED